jgi:ABC-type amino acid transport substrate-binding protein
MDTTNHGLSSHRASSNISALLSKQGVVVTELARRLLGMGVGERLVRIQEHAAQFDVSVGTMQSALDYLQAHGAARLDARGRLGTFVGELHYPLLWSLAHNRPISGCMPLPYSRRFAGLATATRTLFDRQPVGLDLRFIRGANQRLQALASNECDWAVVSRFVAETAGAHGFEVEPVLLLGQGTYVAQHVLIARVADIVSLHDGMRVGVDLQSTDHVYLVRSLSRGRRVELVDIPYNQGLRLVQSGEIDATVWSREDLPLELDTLTTIPLNEQKAPLLSRLGEAVVVINRGNSEVAHVIQAVLDIATLVAIQREVVELERVPNY